MPNALSRFGGGGNLMSTLDREPVSVGPAPDFWGDLDKMRALFKKPAAGPTAVAQGNALMRNPVGARAGRGTRQRTTEKVRSNERGRLSGLMSDGGRHSSVTNIKGGPQVFGGYVSSSAGASPGNTFYGGWQVGPEQGPVQFAGLPSPWEPAIRPAMEMDPTTKSQLNALTLGPSRAESERAARMELMSSPTIEGTSDAVRSRAPMRSYAGSRPSRNSRRRAG